MSGKNQIIGSYLLFTRSAGQPAAPGRARELKALKCSERSDVEIGKLLQNGWEFYDAVGHIQGKPSEEKFLQAISQRNNWPEYCRQKMPLPFTGQEIMQMRSKVDFQGGAYELMMQLHLEREIEAIRNKQVDPRMDTAIAPLFKEKVLPALNELNPKEAAVMIMNYGLIDGNQMQINELANLFRLNRGSIGRIIKKAIAKMVASIISNKIGRPT